MRKETHEEIMLLRRGLKEAQKDAQDYIRKHICTGAPVRKVSAPLTVAE